MPDLSGQVNDSSHVLEPSPRRAVRSECLRAAALLALSPFEASAYLLRRGALRRAAQRDLEHPAEIEPGADGPALPARPLRVFVSSAEHSGEAHACSLVRALRAEAHARGAPEPVFSGLGGRNLGALGVEIIGNPVARAAMGVDMVHSLTFYARLLTDVATHLSTARPDLCVPIDSPALHVPLGRIAHRYGVPVVHFVTPQYWAWAPWRVRGYRQAVDLALTILPFEPSWFARHGVRSAYVGHPELDVLADVPTELPHAERRTLVLLPGSREKVITRNLPWMLVAAARMRLAAPNAEVVLPHDRIELRALLARHVNAGGASGWVRIATGELQAELARARVALTVSGTILVDLLHHRIPCAVVYRLRNALSAAVARRILTVPWFSSINLLAGREVVPEYSFHGQGPIEEVGSYLARCHLDERFRSDVRAGLDEAAGRLGPPGAARRAARHALSAALPATSPV